MNEVMKWITDSMVVRLMVGYSCILCGDMCGGPSYGRLPVVFCVGTCVVVRLMVGYQLYSVWGHVVVHHVVGYRSYSVWGRVVVHLMVGYQLYSVWGHVWWSIIW
jgi:hypothetical protein